MYQINAPGYSFTIIDFKVKFFIKTGVKQTVICPRLTLSPDQASQLYGIESSDGNSKGETVVILWDTLIPSFLFTNLAQ
jgi:hypothetical protein